MNPLFCPPKSVWLSELGKIAFISLSPNVILFDETLTSDKSFNDKAKPLTFICVKLPVDGVVAPIEALLIVPPLNALLVNVLVVCDK